MHHRRRPRRLPRVVVDVRDAISVVVKIHAVGDTVVVEVPLPGHDLPWRIEVEGAVAVKGDREIKE